MVEETFDGVPTGSIQGTVVNDWRVQQAGMLGNVVRALASRVCTWNMELHLDSPATEVFLYVQHQHVDMELRAYVDGWV